MQADSHHHDCELCSVLRWRGPLHCHILIFFYFGHDSKCSGSGFIYLMLNVIFSAVAASSASDSKEAQAALCTSTSSHGE
eukprot:scaffold291360_cov18-Prasinocladus_malaysianus.AAC.1